MSVYNPSFQPPGGMAADPLQSTLRAAARRIRGLRLLRCGSVALGYSALIGLVIVGLSKLRLFPTPSPWIVGLVIVIGLAIGVLVALLPRLTELDIARLTEQRADLKERLSSAVEFRGQTGVEAAAHRGFYGAQYQDASHYAAGIDLKTLYPVRFPRPLAFALPACLLLFLVYFLPGLPMFWTRQQRAEAAEVKARGLHILKLARDAQKAADQQKLPETKKAAEEVRKLGEAMRRNKMGLKEALVAKEKLTRKLEQQQRQLADKTPKKSMEEASRQLKKSMDQTQRELARAQQKQAQQTARAPQKPGQKTPAEPQKESEAMKQMRNAMQHMQQAMQRQSPQQMQQAMQQMAQAMQKGGISKQEMQQMAQMMQQMAQAMQNTEMQPTTQQMQQMAQMMASMDSSDTQQMQQLADMMRQMANGMGKGSKMALASLDAKALANLIGALQAGRLTMAGNGMPGVGPGRGNKGWGGTGVPSKAMKDPGVTHARLLAMAGTHATAAKGRDGSIQQFQKYLGMANKTSKYLPNGQVKGTRSQNGQELSQQMMGDPTGAQSNTPYYQAVETSRKEAESALSKESVPATMKKQVRDYFDSIK